MANLKAQKANSPAPMRVDGTGSFVTDKAVLGLPATSPGALGTPAAADTIDFRVAAGSRVCDLTFVLDDCDTAATFVFGVGYRAAASGSALVASANYFAAAGQTVGQAGGRLECSFKPIKFEEDVFIQIVVGTAPTGVTGNPEIHMIAGVNHEGPK